MSWSQFSIETMKNHLAAGGKIHFDVTHVEDMSGVLAGTGEYANTVTAQELRWMRENWALIRENVTFYYEGAVRSVPW